MEVPTIWGLQNNYHSPTKRGNKKLARPMHKRGKKSEQLFAKLSLGSQEKQKERFRPKVIRSCWYRLHTRKTKWHAVSTPIWCSLNMMRISQKKARESGIFQEDTLGWVIFLWCSMVYILLFLFFLFCPPPPPPFFFFYLPNFRRNTRFSARRDW